MCAPPFDLPYALNIRKIPASVNDAGIDWLPRREALLFRQGFGRFLGRAIFLERVDRPTPAT
jgi:hypothetical protein